MTNEEIGIEPDEPLGGRLIKLLDQAIGAEETRMALLKHRLRVRVAAGRDTSVLQEAVCLCETRLARYRKRRERVTWPKAGLP